MASMNLPASVPDVVIAPAGDSDELEGLSQSPAGLVPIGHPAGKPLRQRLLESGGVHARRLENMRLHIVLELFTTDLLNNVTARSIP